jgi:hypothetical protein
MAAENSPEAPPSRHLEAQAVPLPWTARETRAGNGWLELRSLEAKNSDRGDRFCAKIQWVRKGNRLETYWKPSVFSPWFSCELSHQIWESLEEAVAK